MCVFCFQKYFKICKFCNNLELAVFDFWQVNMELSITTSSSEWKNIILLDMILLVQED